MSAVPLSPTLETAIEGLVWFSGEGSLLQIRDAKAALVAAIQAEVQAARQQVEDQIVEMESEMVLLAKLASEGPQFDNPLHIVAAQRIRDCVLRAVGSAPAPTQEG